MAALVPPLCTIALAQSNLGFLKDTASARFNDQDWAMVRETMRTVLDDSSEEATEVWTNSASGNHGRISVVAAWRSADGRECKKLLVHNYAGRLEGSSHYPLCREEGGQWRFDDRAEP